MKFYNSLTKTVEPFVLSGKDITMYVCGLTPYDSAHIGHARTYVAFDSIKRYLASKGYQVFHIQNITDVDDKIIRRAKETGADPRVLVHKNHDDALNSFDELSIIRADVYPKVTDHIQEIIGLIEKLIVKGYAYLTPSGVYYRVSKFAPYGALSGQKLDEIKAGARVEVDETKENPEDFALWKRTDGELIEFDSPFGRGRPGWHIECSAMVAKHAGRTLDIHGGARDLIFPHHENEIAQSEPVHGTLARFWLHTGFLTVGGEKMSKSLGNFITVRDALGRFSSAALRFFFLQTHYRSPVDYSEENLAAAEETVERIFNAIGLLDEMLDVKKDSEDKAFRNDIEASIAQFYGSLDNDFDTPQALSAFFDIIRMVNAHLQNERIDKRYLAQLRKEFESMLFIFGLGEKKKDAGDKITELVRLADSVSELFGMERVAAHDAELIIEELIMFRDTLRKEKKYEEADRIREKLMEIGIVIEDKEKGKRWKVA